MITERHLQQQRQNISRASSQRHRFELLPSEYDYVMSYTQRRAKYGVEGLLKYKPDKELAKYLDRTNVKAALRVASDGKVTLVTRAAAKWREVATSLDSRSPQYKRVLEHVLYRS